MNTRSETHYGAISHTIIPTCSSSKSNRYPISPPLCLSLSLPISHLLNLSCPLLHAPFPYHYDPLCFSEYEFSRKTLLTLWNTRTSKKAACPHLLPPCFHISAIRGNGRPPGVLTNLTLLDGLRKQTTRPPLDRFPSHDVKHKKLGQEPENEPQGGCPFGNQCCVLTRVT